MDGRNRIYDRISQNYPDVSLQMLGIYCIFAISMTDEQIAAKKEHAGEKKASMKRRDDHHDYTERRMYMITLEVEQYLCCLRCGFTNYCDYGERFYTLVEAPRRAILCLRAGNIADAFALGTP